MGSRETYSEPLSCSKCNTKGQAKLSEWDIPTVYSGVGTRIESLSDNFIEDNTSDRSTLFILCGKCKQRVLEKAK